MPLFRPGKPLALLSLSADDTTTTGFQIPDWDVVDEDPAGQVTAGVVTIDRDGYYLLTSGVGRPAVATAAALFIRLVVNGTTVANGQSAVVTGVVGVTCSRMMFLSAGDTVAMEASASTVAASTFQQSRTFFTVVRLGPVRWT